MCMQLKDRIKEAMAYKGIKPAELARVTRKTPGAVSQWLDGTTKSLKGETAALIEGATGYRASWIVTGKGQKLAAADAPVAASAIAEALPALPSHLAQRIAAADPVTRRLIELALLESDKDAAAQLTPSLLSLVQAAKSLIKDVEDPT